VTKLPLIIRFAIRVALFVVCYFAIGLASALAGHFLGISRLTRAGYEGGLNMLLTLWFFGLLRTIDAALASLRPDEEVGK
jgi:hypothetical protein